MPGKFAEYQGTLYIDQDNGIAYFATKDGRRILRVTHLSTPVLPDTSIDVVAISNVTSYSPLQAGE